MAICRVQRNDICLFTGPTIYFFIQYFIYSLLHSSSPSDSGLSSQNESPHPLSQATTAGQVGVATSGRGGAVSDDEEDCEPIEVDELVFDRDEYHSGA